MHITLKVVFLCIFLIAAATVSFAQNQFILEIKDESGKPVRGATVSVDCGDGITRKGVTDIKGEAGVAVSSSANCNFVVTGRGIVPQAVPLAMSQYPTGAVVSVQRAEPGSELKILLYDYETGRPVRGASVNINCGDGVARAGVTDVKGAFEPPILPSWARCFMTISGNDIVGYKRELAYTTKGILNVDVTRKPAAMKQATAQKGVKKNNTNPQKPQNDFDAELDAIVDEEMNKPPTRSPRGGSNPNVKPGNDDLDDLLDGELDDDKPKPPVIKKPGKADDDDLDDLIDGELDDDKPKPTKPTKPLLEKYMEFWGTWRGTKVAAGITFVLNPDGTGTHKDTRPGYQKYWEGSWGPNATTGCIDTMAFRLCMHRDGTITDPWGNVYTR